jgi:UDP-glucose 4-epimerase
MTQWTDRNVMVTGGASFIGSHLVEQLVELGAKVTVIDNFSSGRMENLSNVKEKIKINRIDIETSSRVDLEQVVKGNDVQIIFHFAAKHGGRGYINSHPADVCSNMTIDNNILNLALKADVEKIVMASSACVYPPRLQKESSDYMLKESDTDVTKLEDYLSADIEYGWAKVMGEMQLRAFHKQYDLKGASMRFVTAYGPRENETHAIMALIYKAMNHQDPFEIWGDGKQDRDFTYVKDITLACIKAAEVADIGEYNVGTGKRYSINQVSDMIFNILGWKPSKTFYNAERPTGVYSRALDISKARKELNWKPKFSLKEGLNLTIEWYKAHGNFNGVSERLLLERTI